MSARSAVVAVALLAGPGLTAQVGADAVTLRWSAVPGATRYDVQLFDDTQRGIGGKTVDDTVWVAQRATDLTGAQPGAVVHWRVTAYNGEVSVSESPAATFTLR